MGLARNYLGKAGHLAAMGEFLVLGYNVAIPEVDVGDDIFVVDDQEGNLWRVQVKTALGAKGAKGQRAGQYLLPRAQLEEKKNVELYYVFALREEASWDFVVISRKELYARRIAFEARTAPKKAAEQINLKLTFTTEGVWGWEEPFTAYRKAFARYFPQKPR